MGNEQSLSSKSKRKTSKSISNVERPENIIHASPSQTFQASARMSIITGGSHSSVPGRKVSTSSITAGAHSQPGRKVSTSSIPASFPTRKLSTQSYTTKTTRTSSGTSNDVRFMPVGRNTSNPSVSASHNGDLKNVFTMETKSVVTAMGNTTSSVSLDNHTTDRRSRLKDFKYQSVRGTSFEPKTQHDSRPHLPSSFKEHPSPNVSADLRKSLSSKQNSLDDDAMEKLKSSKKGKRIALIKTMRTELWDFYEFGERKKLNLTLNPTFNVENKPHEITCHSLDIHFMKVADEKLEERQQLYDFEVTFSEAKFTLEKPGYVSADRLVRAHSFYGLSRNVELTEDLATIEGNFYNPEYGKMDFFTFELVLFPASKRCPIKSDEDNNNEEPILGTSRQEFLKRYRDIQWGTFFMKVRGSYTSKEYLWTATERPSLESVATPDIKRKNEQIIEE